MKKDIPFAQESLGEMLFLLSELRQANIQWLYEQSFDKEEAVESINGALNVSHGTSWPPQKGIPYLQIYQSISINFGGFEDIVWRVLINLSLDGEQTLQARRWLESPKHLGDGGHTIKEIAHLQLENGNKGIEAVQEVCKLISSDIHESLSTITATKMYHQSIDLVLKKREEYKAKGAKS